MIPTFSKTAQRILPVLFENPLHEFKEIELITKAGTGKGAAAALISDLVTEGILLVKRSGKTKMISLALQNPAVFWLKNLLEQEKMKHFSPTRLAAALYFTQESSAHLVIIFGSTIAGTATAESDIDLLVVSPDTVLAEKARKKTEEWWGHKLNLHFYSREDLIDKSKNDPFVQNVLVQGIILQGYGLASGLYSNLQPTEKKPLERIYYFKERITAAERNYYQGDQAAAQEILSTLQEQLIFYILTEQGISYQSKKDAAETLMKLPEGKVFKSIVEKPLKEKIEIINIVVQQLLTNTIIEEAGYGFAIRN